MDCLETRKFYELVKIRKNSLEKLIAKIEKSLAKAPEGNLLISKCRDNSQFYLREDSKQKKGKYIKKGERDLIKKLAQKKYDQKLLFIAKKEMESLNRIDTSHESNPYERLSDKMNLGLDYIKPLYPQDDEFLKKWNDEDYSHMGFSEDSPKFYSRKGERMRSKSETIIANALEKYGIPYMYEYPIEIAGRNYHPDFKILNLRTRETIYWEHFGMMDDRDYLNESVRKINVYTLHGLVLGGNLIATYETIKTPLDCKVVETMVQTYCM